MKRQFPDFRKLPNTKVFPELKEWCEERKIQLIECDLRWGVPKDSNTHDTICACMEELDRCFEENDEQPFFLNLLSERFGWVPTEAEVPEDIRTRYNWVNGASITLMEILHGAYRTKNPNAAFFIRDEKFLKDIPKDYTSKFVDEKPASKQHLKVLKQKLKHNFPSQFWFQRDSEFWKVSEEDNMIMCVTGAVGHGKTSVMAKVVREALKI
ncbi:hypothetical protein KUTeg_007929 [Tegillarca granosa]|uniref:Uncharacterized protein n=1 Tax=Tegillarca granosa TaxID=220873 RepID=A0ABQ9FER2_TEGGR|nr:hypothetical protein KUTeg_007929 [Tegillarca granosa]